ncbi:hypothetical protein D3C76_1138170 [compost metagenome]
MLDSHFDQPVYIGAGLKGQLIGFPLLQLQVSIIHLCTVARVACSGQTDGQFPVQSPGRACSVKILRPARQPLRRIKGSVIQSAACRLFWCTAGYLGNNDIVQRQDMRSAVGCFIRTCSGPDQIIQLQRAVVSDGKLRTVSRPGSSNIEFCLPGSGRGSAVFHDNLPWYGRFGLKAKLIGFAGLQLDAFLV